MSTDTIINGVNVEKMLEGYVECALWSSSVEEEGLAILRADNDHDVSDHACADWSMDRCELDVGDIHPDSLKSMREDVEGFLRGPEVHDLSTDQEIATHEHALDFWSANRGGDDYIGHDFWLTRNHHGTGFWDRYSGDQEGTRIGQYLTDQAHAYGESYLYVGDDGKVHAS